VVQAVHHATEHRKQVCHLMRLLGLKPPWLDAWSFGEAMGDLVTLDDPS